MFWYHNEIDSKILDRHVIEFSDIETEDDVSLIEKQLRKCNHNTYSVAKVPSERVSIIHELENQGFRFLEHQLRLSVEISRPFDCDPCPFDFVVVDSTNVLEKVIDIAATVFEHDRITADPLFSKVKSGARYSEYVRRSFLTTSEEVSCLICRDTGSVIGFITHRVTSPQSANQLLVGTLVDCRRNGVGKRLLLLNLNRLLEQGVRYVFTHIAGRNYPIMNLELRSLGYRVESSCVVLRKAQ